MLQGMPLEGREPSCLLVWQFKQTLVDDPAHTWVWSVCGEKSPLMALWYHFPAAGLVIEGVEFLISVSSLFLSLVRHLNCCLAQAMVATKNLAAVWPQVVGPFQLETFVGTFQSGCWHLGRSYLPWKSETWKTLTSTLYSGSGCISSSFMVVVLLFQGLNLQPARIFDGAFPHYTPEGILVMCRG